MKDSQRVVGEEGLGESIFLFTGISFAAYKYNPLVATLRTIGK